MPKAYKMIKHLELLSKSELVQQWNELFSHAPSQSLRREFLIKHLAWEIQTQSQGGYSAQTKKKLEALAKDLEQNKEISNDNLKSSSLTIKAGTKLIREYQGKNHEVIVLL